MARNQPLATLGLVALLVAMTTAIVPPYIRVCGRRDPQIDKCILESVGNMTDKLKTGIPELDVPSLEPLEINKLALADLDEFRAFATNVKLTGLSNFVIKKLRTDLQNQKFDIELLFPRVAMDASYDVQAKIIVPITDKGPIHTITENVYAKATIKFQTLDRQGKKLIYFPSMTTKVTIKEYKAVFKPDADSKSSALAQAINSVLVNSQKEIIESMTPNIEKAISEKVLEVSNRICKHFTYDELFPDRE